MAVDTGNDTPGSMRVYAANYRMLLRVLGAMPDRAGAVAVAGEGTGQLRVELLERARYTSTIRLDHCLGGEAACLPDVSLKVRAYHDARVAEVIDYQGGNRFQPRYSYPNPAMRLPDEKGQVNRFLEDWLRYCLRLGLRRVADAADV